MTQTALFYIFALYLAWAALVAGKLFHQIWAATLLSLVFLTDTCLQQESGLYSILYGLLCLLNLAVCLALSPAQVLLFKQKGTYQSAKQVDQFLPDVASDSQSSDPISVE